MDQIHLRQTKQQAKRIMALACCCILALTHPIWPVYELFFYQGQKTLSSLGSDHSQSTFYSAVDETYHAKEMDLNSYKWGQRWQSKNDASGPLTHQFYVDIFKESAFMEYRQDYYISYQPEKYATIFGWHMSHPWWQLQLNTEKAYNRYHQNLPLFLNYKLSLAPDTLITPYISQKQTPFYADIKYRDNSDTINAPAWYQEDRCQYGAYAKPIPQLNVHYYHADIALRSTDTTNSTRMDFDYPGNEDGYQAAYQITADQQISAHYFNLNAMGQMKAHYTKNNNYYSAAIRHAYHNGGYGICYQLQNWHLAYDVNQIDLNNGEFVKGGDMAFLLTLFPIFGSFENKGYDFDRLSFKWQNLTLGYHNFFGFDMDMTYTQLFLEGAIKEYNIIIFKSLDEVHRLDVSRLDYINLSLTKQMAITDRISLNGNIAQLIPIGSQKSSQSEISSQSTMSCKSINMQSNSGKSVWGGLRYQMALTILWD